MEHNVTRLLLRLGIAPENKGFKALRTAILLVLDRPKLIDYVTEGLYKETASRLGWTAGQVERNMRVAIETAAKDNWEDILLLPLPADKPKHSNAKFVALCAEIVRTEA